MSGGALSGGALSGGGDEAAADATVLASRVVAALAERRRTLAVAESLTGGLLGAAITSVPGASEVFRGGIIAYAADLKAVLLGVPVTVLDEHGTVHPEVAVAMAEGARDRLEADVGVGTTGVAGPDPVDGKPPGTVHIGVATAQRQVSRSLSLHGDRPGIREATVSEALGLLLSVLGEESP